MSTKYIRSNILSFIISYTLLVLFLFFMSYKFFLDDFILLENKQNQSNIKSFLNNINNDLESLKNVTHDYAVWDDTYDFVNDENDEYIYENFREGTLTLQNLKLDGIVFINLENKILFSTYTNKKLKEKKSDFENFLITKFNDKENLNQVISFESNFLYLSKNQILKSDESGKVKGHIFTIKSLSNDFFNESYTIFKNISIDNEKTLNSDLKIDLPLLKNIKIKVDTTNENILNSIDFFNYNNEYVISIHTTNPRDIVMKGKETIYTFNFLVSGILFFIFFFIYKNQYLIQTQNDTLNKEVAKRTRQLDKAFRKLKDRNKELYTLANIDSLTKIKNRRSFFLESEEALEKAIRRKHNLCILMIDIDHFKAINDTYGHAVGDNVLIQFCLIVDSVINNNDDAIFGRIGGEEFCITFYNKNIEDVNEISEMIRNKCENSEIIIDNHNIKFTVSMGLSCREDLVDIDKILHKSDELLYEAKKSGRNRLVRTNR